MPVKDDHHDGDMAAQFERIIRRVKHSMNYRGSYSTQDILGSLVARWVQSGEWDRLKQVPPGERRIGESVRRFILDRLGQIRRRGDRDDVSPDQLVLPDDGALAELVDAARLRAWIHERVADLERDVVDPRVRIQLVQPAQIGRALHMHLDGHTQRQIAKALGVSLGLANKRVQDGTNYLIVLQGVEQGIGASA